VVSTTSVTVQAMSERSKLLAGKDDVQLVASCLSEEQGAWDELYTRYRRKVFNIAYQFVGKFDEAEDLTQEIFIKVFRALERFDAEGNFQQWLIRISKNHSIDHYRRRRKDREMLLEGSLQLDMTPSKTRNPYRALELNERAAMFKRALTRLPPILRTCLTLRELEGLSYQEIASKLDVPEGTVKSRINRARSEMNRLVGKMRQGG
jgi:RNA polymerase sigma-70 factor (ECF subfamily)